MCKRLELDGGDTVVMGMERTMTITKVKTPNFDGLISRARDKDSRVIRYIESEDRKFMSIESKEKLE